MVDDDSSVRAPDGDSSAVGGLESLTVDIRKLTQAVDAAPFADIQADLTAYQVLKTEKGNLETEYEGYRERAELQSLRLHDYESLGTLDYCRGLVAATTELENKVRESGILNEALQSDNETAEERVTQIVNSTRAELALLGQYQAVKGENSSPEHYAQVVQSLGELEEEKSRLQQTNTQLQAKQQQADEIVSIFRSELQAATARVNELTQWYKTKGAPSP